MPSAKKPVTVAQKRARKRFSLLVTGGIILALVLAGAAIAYSQVFKSQDSRSQAGAGGVYCAGAGPGLVETGYQACGANNCRPNERYRVTCLNGNRIADGCRLDSFCTAYCHQNGATKVGNCAEDGCTGTQKPNYVCIGNLWVKGCRAALECGVGGTRPVAPTPVSNPGQPAPNPGNPGNPGPGGQPPADPGPLTCTVGPVTANPNNLGEFSTTTARAGETVRFRCTPNQPTLRTFMGLYVSNKTTKALEFQANSPLIDQTGQQMYTAPITLEAGMKIECMPYSETKGYATQKCEYVVR